MYTREATYPGYIGGIYHPGYIGGIYHPGYTGGTPPRVYGKYTPPRVYGRCTPRVYREVHTQGIPGGVHPGYTRRCTTREVYQEGFPTGERRDLCAEVPLFSLG